MRWAFCLQGLFRRIFIFFAGSLTPVWPGHPSSDDREGQELVCVCGEGEVGEKSPEGATVSQSALRKPAQTFAPLTPAPGAARPSTVQAVVPRSPSACAPQSPIDKEVAEGVSSGPYPGRISQTLPSHSVCFVFIHLSPPLPLCFGVRVKSVGVILSTTVDLI